MQCIPARLLRTFTSLAVHPESLRERKWVTHHHAHSCILHLLCETPDHFQADVSLQQGFADLSRDEKRAVDKARKDRGGQSLSMAPFVRYDSFQQGRPRPSTCVESQLATHVQMPWNAPRMMRDAWPEDNQHARCVAQFLEVWVTLGFVSSQV